MRKILNQKENIKKTNMKKILNDRKIIKPNKYLKNSMPKKEYEKN